MLRVNENTRLHFEYGTSNVTYSQNGRTVVKEKPSISCILTNNEDELIDKVVVTRHHTDNDDRIKGRTYAVLKLTDKLDDRNTKKDVWRAINNNNIKLKF